MKYLFFFVNVLLLSSFRLYSQNIETQHPDWKHLPTDQINSVTNSLGESEDAAISIDQNYIKKTVYLGVQGENNTSIQYFDGLGRLTQTIEAGITPGRGDLVFSREYDKDRVIKEFLPVPLNSNYGAYKENAATSASNHYEDSNPYAEVKYDDSPLNQISSIYGPGSAWHSLHKRKLINYWINTGEGDLKALRYSTWGDLLYSNATPYAEGELYVTKNIDEDGNRYYEFTDKSGKKVLLRKFYGSSQYDTYFVYDNSGNLRYVLPPLASDQLKNEGLYAITTGNVLDKYAYFYKYDLYNRCVEVKKPGIKSEYRVYDRSDKLVLTQTGNQRLKNVWTVYKYDRFGRTIYVSEVEPFHSHADLINSFKDWFVTENFSISPQPNPMEDTGYSRNFYYGEPTKLLTVNYYDDYRFLTLLPTDIQSALTYQPRSGYGVKFENANTLLTGTRTYMLDNPGEYIATAYYYDEKGRIIQERTTNSRGGYDASYHTYGFTGNILKTRKEYTNSLAPVSPSTEQYQYFYDHANRVIKTLYQINNNPVTTLSENIYDELGRVTTKYRHNRMDTIFYEYNIRNSLTRIKNGDFEQWIYYDSNPFDMNKSRYNGNVSALQWRYGDQINAYLYQYDPLNRLQKAQSYSGDNQLAENGYSEQYFHDKHGNVTTLLRYSSNQLLDFLDMTYSGNQVQTATDYLGSWDQYAVKEYHDLANQSVEFYYDDNGNLISDADREIVAIRYNLLNLPDTIQFKNGNQIVYHYLADGRQVKSEYFTLTTPLSQPVTGVCKWNVNSDPIDHSTKTYWDNRIYTTTNGRNITTYTLFNSEGYSECVMSNRINSYYYTKDYLGNNVLCRLQKLYTTPAARIFQQMQYYPSGLPWKDSHKPDLQEYKFGSKEFIETHGYDSYNHGSRRYYAARNQWEAFDPLAENHYDISPYAFCGNDPVNRIDPDGRDWFKDKNGNYLWIRSSAATIEYDGVEYTNIGSNLSFQLFDGFFINYYQNAFISVSLTPQNAFATIMGDLALQNRLLSSSSPLNDDYKSQIFNTYINRKTHEVAKEMYSGAILLLSVVDGAAMVGGIWNLGKLGWKAVPRILSMGKKEAAKEGGSAFRYMTEAELQSIQKTGLLRGGRAGETFFTKDLYKSANHAQQRLALPSAPTLRVEFQILNNPTLLRNGTKVQPAFGMSGKGAEFMTLDPVNVKLINWQPLR